MESDDDIEIVESDKRRSGGDDICQLCSCNLSGQIATERTHHYSEHSKHKSSRATGSRSRRGRPKTVTTQRKLSPMKLVKNGKKAVQDDVFWYPTLSTVPPDNYTPGVLAILKDALRKSHEKHAVHRAVLCYERTPHIHCESFDKKWGCAYRNFLMTCAALMDQQLQTVYFALLDSPSSPSVRNLQQWIQDAWEHGYDEVGARQLDERLVDTEKKIGTADLYVAFTSRKIPCMLIDFDLRKSPKGFDTLTEWVVNHFTEKREGNVNEVLLARPSVLVTNKMPVIMQFDGHSVTIVGYELKNGRYNLLALDPSSKVPQDVRQAALNTPTNAVLSSSSSLLTSRSEPRGRSKSSPRKRSRANKDSDDRVASIPDSDVEVDDPRQAAALRSNPDPEKVIKLFRLGEKYKKKQDYQLLYFTMGDPLTDLEQNHRKVVFAEC